MELVTELGKVFWEKVKTAQFRDVEEPSLQILFKPVQWLKRMNMRTDGRTDVTNPCSVFINAYANMQKSIKTVGIFHAPFFGKGGKVKLHNPFLSYSLNPKTFETSEFAP